MLRSRGTGSRNLVALVAIAVVAAFWIAPRLINTPSLASSPSSTPVAAIPALTATPAPVFTPTLTATPKPTATPSPTPTATPVPNDYFWIPWRSQFDGTAYETANCGPASLGMAMSYFGEWWETKGIRKSTNERSGVTGYSDGTDWPSLAYAAEKRDFTVVGLYDAAGNYRQWTIDDLVSETDKGHPVILLVRQRAMPGHENSAYYGDHYIVFLGLMADGRIVYHDPAFANETDGAYRIIGQKTLLEAWGDTYACLPYSAMSVVWEHEGRKWDDSTTAEATPTPNAE
jgi:hypothetical protein